MSRKHPNHQHISDFPRAVDDTINLRRGEERLYVAPPADGLSYIIGYPLREGRPVTLRKDRGASAAILGSRLVRSLGAGDHPAS